MCIRESICDNGFEFTFNQTNVNIQLNTKTLRTGYREQSTGLGRVKLDIQQKAVNHKAHGQANSIVPAGTIADTVKFLHMACFSPSKSTLIRAVENGNFATWPMFTSHNIKKYLPKSEATTMGHLDQQRKNIQSTRRTQSTTSLTTNSATHGLQAHGTSDPFTPITERTHQTYTDLLDFHSPTGQIHTDQTGRFPVQSSRGSKYIMILFDYDINAILAEAMNSRTAQEMVRA